MCSVSLCSRDVCVKGVYRAQTARYIYHALMCLVFLLNRDDDLNLSNVRIISLRVFLPGVFATSLELFRH